MHPARYLLAPLWLAQLATGAKSFRDNPIIGSQRLNTLGLHATRVKWAHAMAARRRKTLRRLIGVADRENFDRDGFVVISEFLPADLFARLRDAVLSYHGPARDMIQGDTITRRFALDPKLLRAIPEARTLLQDSRWRGLIRYAGSFDSEPLTYIQSILSHARDADPDPQTHYHADTFHPTVKAWLFLTDVAEDEGPFCYVPGSHRLTPERLAWEQSMSLKAPDGVDRLSARGSFRVTPEELPALGLPHPAAFAVPPGALYLGFSRPLEALCRPALARCWG